MDEKSHELEDSPVDVAAGQLSTYIKPQARKLHDPAVSFEEYHYYALRTREEEKSVPAPKTDWRRMLLGKQPAHELTGDSNGNVDSRVEKHSGTAPTEINISSREKRLEISDQEWTDASRAFRTASWGACFYL